jgi:hypothetical protein
MITNHEAIMNDRWYQRMLHNLNNEKKLSVLNFEDSQSRLRATQRLFVIVPAAYTTTLFAVLVFTRAMRATPATATSRARCRAVGVGGRATTPALPFGLAQVQADTE